MFRQVSAKVIKLSITMPWLQQFSAIFEGNFVHIATGVVSEVDHFQCHAKIKIENILKMLSNRLCCFQHCKTTSHTVALKDGRQNGDIWTICS